jgi:adenylosuccinate lyase
MGDETVFNYLYSKYNFSDYISSNLCFDVNPFLPINDVLNNLEKTKNFVSYIHTKRYITFDPYGKDFSNLEKSIANEFGFENTWASVGQIYPRSVDFEVVSKLLQIAASPSSMATTIRLMAGSGLVSEGFKAGQVGSSAMPHKMNSRSSERINGMMVLLRGYNNMAADLAGDQWNEGDVSCSVVRRVVIPDSFYVLDGLLHTFMTILQEFGAFEEKIKAELDEQLPLLATTKLLMECVKAGMGREAAHQIIKKHSTSTAPGELFNALASEKEFPLSSEQVRSLTNFMSLARTEKSLSQTWLAIM